MSLSAIFCCLALDRRNSGTKVGWLDRPIRKSPLHTYIYISCTYHRWQGTYLFIMYMHCHTHIHSFSVASTGQVPVRDIDPHVCRLLVFSDTTDSSLLFGEDCEQGRCWRYTYILYVIIAVTAQTTQEQRASKSIEHASLASSLLLLPSLKSKQIDLSLYLSLSQSYQRVAISY